MLKPQRMCKVECVVAKDKTEALLRELHRQGLAQIDDVGDEELIDTGLTRNMPLAQEAEVAQTLIRVRDAKDNLAGYGTEAGGFITELLGVEDITARTVPDLDYPGLRSWGDKLLAEIEEEVTQATTRLTQLTEQQKRLQEKLGAVEPAGELDLPIDYFGEDEMLYTVIGLITAEEATEVSRKLDDELSGEYCAVGYSQHKGFALAAYSVQRSSRGQLDSILGSHGFVEVPSDGDGTFRQLAKKLTGELGDVTHETGQVKAGLTHLHEKRFKDLLVLEELFVLEEEKANAARWMGATEKSRYLRMWTPKADLSRLLALLNEKAKDGCAITVDEDPQDAPTLLSNPPYLKPFEAFTRLYSMPRYNQIDPTFITAPTFVLFFGYMLGDAVYGLALSALALLLKRKYGSLGQVGDLSHILLMCGLATTFFGVLSGSYLGDFMGTYVLGVPTREMPLVLIDPLYKSNAVLLLYVAVAVGIMQVLFGNVVGALDRLMNRDIKGSITDYGSWLLMAGSVGLYLAGFSFAPILFALGFLLLAYGKGFMAVMELPGIIGRVVSYARLLALSLTTPAMGKAFNFLAALTFSLPVAGPLMAAAAFIGSHAMILFMNSLGSFVHSLRLHYVEFYGTFYDGGGIEYHPFIEKRRYTQRR